MDFFKSINFSLSQCDITDIISETNRFLIHITLIHIFAHILDKEKPLFGLELLQTLVITALAVITYNILFKKLIDSKLNIARSKCQINDSDFEATYELK